MQINSQYNFKNNISFKGYDARALRGFLMMTNNSGVADEMYKIGKKEGFDVFFSNNCMVEPFKEKMHKYLEFSGEWAQDFFSFLKSNKLLALDLESASGILSFFKLKLSEAQKDIFKRKGFNELKSLLTSFSRADFVGENKLKISTNDGREYLFSQDDFQNKVNEIFHELNSLVSRSHVPGGNFFIVKNKLGEEILLVGEDELKKFDKGEISKMFSTKNIEFLPQMDFHIDMFMRPLRDGKVLLCDDNLTLKVMNDYLSKLSKALKNMKV